MFLACPAAHREVPWQTLFAKRKNMSKPLTILIVGAGELGEAILSALAAHPSRTADTKIHVPPSRRRGVCSKMSFPFGCRPEDG